MYNDCSPCDSVLSLQQHTHIPKKTSNSQPDLMSILWLQLFRISPSLDYLVSCAAIAKIPWGSMAVCAFPSPPAMFWSPECQALSLTVGGCSLPWSHCTSSNKNDQVKRLGLLRRNLYMCFSDSRSRFMLKKTGNRSGLVLKVRCSLQTQSYCIFVCARILKVAGILSMTFPLLTMKVIE